MGLVLGREVMVQGIYENIKMEVNQNIQSMFLKFVLSLSMWLVCWNSNYNCKETQVADLVCSGSLVISDSVQLHTKSEELQWLFFVNSMDFVDSADGLRMGLLLVYLYFICLCSVIRLVM